MEPDYRRDERAGGAVSTFSTAPPDGPAVPDAAGREDGSPVVRQVIVVPERTRSLKTAARHVVIGLLGLFGLASTFALLSTIGYAAAWAFSTKVASPWDYSAIGIIFLAVLVAIAILCWAVGTWVLSATGNESAVPGE